jgi:hypothetical protein
MMRKRKIIRKAIVRQMWGKLIIGSIHFVEYLKHYPKSGLTIRVYPVNQLNDARLLFVCIYRGRRCIPFQVSTKMIFVKEM